MRPFSETVFISENQEVWTPTTGTAPLDRWKRSPYDPSIRFSVRATRFGGAEAVAWLLTTMPVVRLVYTAEARFCAHDASGVRPCERSETASASAVLAATLPAGRVASTPSAHCASESPCAAKRRWPRSGRRVKPQQPVRS